MEDFRILDPDPYNNSTGSASLINSMHNLLAPAPPGVSRDGKMSSFPHELIFWCPDSRNLSHAMVGTPGTIQKGHTVFNVKNAFWLYLLFTV